jgi:hypothetical protein
MLVHSGLSNAIALPKKEIPVDKYATRGLKINRVFITF